MTRRSESPILAEALRCAARGWAVFPCQTNSKKPATKNGFKAASPNPAAIQSFWNRRPNANLAIATGAVSHIVILDVDVRNGGDDSMDALERDHGPLPATVESLTGGGGRHILFRHPGGYVPSRSNALGPGLDIKADGGYIIAPPSVHPNGKSYEWELSSHPDEVEMVDIPNELLPLLRIRNTYTEDTEDPEDTDASDDTGNTRNSGNHAASLVQIDSIETAIRLTLPSMPGERHRKIFEFARALKAMPEYANRSPEQLRRAVEKWHQSSVSLVSGEHDFFDTWSDFLYAWPRIRFPLGADPIRAITERARATTMPSGAPAYKAKPICLLVCLCRELQRHSKDPHFYLTCRAAANAIGVDKDRVAKYMNMLCVDGVLEIVHRGHTGRASEYRYLLGD